MNLQSLDYLQPDVFFHLAWLSFLAENKEASPELPKTLFQVAGQYNENGDADTACRVLFLCAALAKSKEEYATALTYLQTAWKLSVENALAREALWSAWGTAVMQYLSGDYEATIESMDWLSNQLAESNDWVLTNLLAILRGCLIESGKSQANNSDAIEVFNSWGCPPPGLISSIVAQTTNTFTQSVEPGLIWGLVRRIVSGEVRMLILNSDDRIVTTQLSNQGANAIIVKRGSNHSLEIYCFGPFQVFLNDQPVDSWISQKARLILKYLAAHYKSPVSKEMLMDLFWMDTDPEAARRNLHQTIYFLRRTLHEKDPDFQHIQFENDFYRLNPEMNLWIDVKEFDRRVASGQQYEIAGEYEKTIAEYIVAEGLYQDNFLVDEPYEEWCLQLRREYNQKYITLTLELAEDYLRKEEFTTSNALCRKVLAIEPCQEEAHQILIKGYADRGLRQRAMDQYHYCAQILKSEFDLPPSQLTNSLYQQAKQI